MLDVLKTAFTVRPPQPTQLVASGLYHFQRKNSDGAYTRLHLRVEKDGSGLLIANASEAVRLSAVGVQITKSLLENEPDAALEKRLTQTFRGATNANIQSDMRAVRTMLATLADPSDRYPILSLTQGESAASIANLIAPLHADVELVGPERLAPRLQRLWEIGVPHVTFCLTENFDTNHLVRAVERAEDTGLIAGVRASASDLAQDSLLHDLAQAGADHINIFYASTDAATHNALLGFNDQQTANALWTQIFELEMCPVAEIPLVESTLDTLNDTLEALQQAGVQNVALFAVAATAGDSGAVAASALPQIASDLEAHSHERALQYTWQAPVERDPRLSLAMQARRGARCADDVSVRVTADGRVLLPRGPATSAGNLLTDSWDTLWNSAAVRAYRALVTTNNRCDTCPGLALCVTHCPKHTDGWSQIEIRD